MIYSKWKPSTGGYDYFQAPDADIPLGDDLPIPSLPSSGPIGIASTDAGRPLPAGARLIGSGPQARGLITPLGVRGGLGALTEIVPGTYWAMAAGVFLGWLVFTKRFKLP